MPLARDNNSLDIKLAMVKDSPQGLPSGSLRLQSALYQTPPAINGGPLVCSKLSSLDV